VGRPTQSIGLRVMTGETSNDLPRVGDIDKLIHELARLTIMANLYVVESVDALFLRRQTGLTWGNLSSHMSKLEEAYYIEVMKGFVDKKPRKTLSLTPAGGGRP
jgi:DNA-binding MarR family transcriptional regulator